MAGCILALLVGAFLLIHAQRPAGGGDARAEAERWLAESGEGQVLTDDQMRTTLLTAHWDPARLPSVSACERAGCRPTWVVATPALRRTGAGAPMASGFPVAVFGDGDQRVEIRHPESGPGDPPAAEERARVAVGQALSDSGRIEASDPVRDLITAGRADPRILATLAGLVSGGTVQVRDLPAVSGEDAADQPRRQLLLDLPAGKVNEVRGYYAAQQGPYRPSAVTPLPTGLRVVYPPVAPPGLLQGLSGS